LSERARKIELRDGGGSAANALGVVGCKGA